VQLQDTAEAARLELACTTLDEETDAGAILLYRLRDDSEPSPPIVHAPQSAGDVGRACSGRRDARRVTVNAAHAARAGPSPGATILSRG